MTAAEKETRTREELSAMALADLSEMDGCPQNGIRVVVYGSNPWKTPGCRSAQMLDQFVTGTNFKTFLVSLLIG